MASAFCLYRNIPWKMAPIFRIIISQNLNFCETQSIKAAFVYISVVQLTIFLTAQKLKSPS